MNAGKSTAMLQVAHNYEEQGQQVRLFTAAIDNRYGVGQVTSRLGPQRQTEVFDADTDFLARIDQKIACLLIDEAQFLTADQVRQLHRLAHVHDLPVVCWGLRSDFQGEPFAGAAMLLTLADQVEEMRSICACARKATMNIRIDADGRRVQRGEQVVIGGNERYRAVCPACFYSDTASAPQAPGLFG